MILIANGLTFLLSAVLLTAVGAGECCSELLPARRAPRPVFHLPALVEADVRTRRPASRKGLPAEDGALLEFLRDRGRSSDLSPEATCKRLYQLLADPVRFARLARAALDEPPRVRAMLGALGTEVGARTASATSPAATAHQRE